MKKLYVYDYFQTDRGNDWGICVVDDEQDIYEQIIEDLKFNESLEQDEKLEDYGIDFNDYYLFDQVNGYKITLTQIPTIDVGDEEHSRVVNLPDESEVKGDLSKIL